MAKLSAHYATALFELAVESGAESAYLEQALLLRETLQDADCRHVLVHPHIPAGEKRAFFSKAFAGRIGDHLLSFLYLTIDKNREAYFLPALSELIVKIERHQGKVTAKVRSAEALDSKQVAALKKTLEKKLGKQVEVLPKTDPSVIGGPYIYVDGCFIDRTVKRRLKDLTAEMKERCGA